MALKILVCFATLKWPVKMICESHGCPWKVVLKFVSVAETPGWISAESMETSEAVDKSCLRAFQPNTQLQTQAKPWTNLQVAMPHNYSLLIQNDPFWATSASSTPFIKLGWVMHIFTALQILRAGRAGPRGRQAIEPPFISEQMQIHGSKRNTNGFSVIPIVHVSWRHQW